MALLSAAQLYVLGACGQTQWVTAILAIAVRMSKRWRWQVAASQRRLRQRYMQRASAARRTDPWPNSLGLLDALWTSDLYTVDQESSHEPYRRLDGVLDPNELRRAEQDLQGSDVDLASP